MLRWLTAGESHGPLLTAIVEGMPAGVAITSSDIEAALARRRLGFGRGARMKFEADAVRITGGVRHGRTIGGPVAIEVGNSEWPRWDRVMAADPVDPDELAGIARNTPLTRPRPGHADLAGMQKYGFDDIRPVLERASARETAARVALGAVAAAFLQQAAGVELVSHIVQIGSVLAPPDARPPSFADRSRIDADPARAADPALGAAMVAEIEAAHKDGDTLGGVAEVVVDGMPPGVGSYVHWDRRLDSRLAGALMGIQAIKSVEVGDGLRLAGMRGSAAQDEIVPSDDGLRRTSGHSGGIEGGMTTGERIRVRAAMKPISTVPRALRTSMSPPVSPRSPSTSDPTCARSPRPGSSPRRWSRSPWPMPCSRSSAATASARPGATSRRTSTRSRCAEMPVAVVLVGAPGSGKTTVGRTLAQALGVAFRDTDADVAAAAGMDVHDIFVLHGEDRFRALEREAVLAALDDHDGVLAVGGGAILSPQVRDALRGLPVVWLRVDAATAVARVGLSGPRPVLLGNVRGQWAALSESREPLYREVARWAIDTSGATPHQVSDTILQRMADHD